jgi:ribosomal protein S18
LKAQITHALPLYGKELKDFVTAKGKIDNEKKSRGKTRQTATDARNKKRSTMVVEAKSLLARQKTAENELMLAEAAFNDAKKQVDKAKAEKAKAAAKKSTGYEAKQQKVTAAKETFYKAQKAYGTNERKIVKLDENLLPKVLDEVKKDVDMLKRYKTSAAAIRVPKAE